MGRNYTDFLSAYFEYAKDNFCPDEFHRWTGISLIAAALERKVSIRQGKINHFPNVYVMLVSHPGVGKSTVMDIGTDLVEALREEHDVDFRIIPNQATEPALVDLMKIIKFSQVTPTVVMQHSSGYFYASEASASALQNMCGDFVAALTHFYDCPKYFRKKLKGEQNSIEIKNSCMNLLAGTTFDYLKELVNEQKVMGGFASRLIYVVSRERKIRQSKWDEAPEVDLETRRRLIEDLAHIHKLAGPMKPTKEWKECFEAFQPEFDQSLIDMNSPRLESIFARKGTNLIKLSMILSVSERDDLVVNEDHFRMAEYMINEVTKDNPFILSQAVVANRDSQSGLNQIIMQSIKNNGGVMTIAGLRSILVANGNDVTKIDPTLNNLRAAEMIVQEGEKLILRTNPDRHL